MQASPASAEPPGAVEEFFGTGAIPPLGGVADATPETVTGRNRRRTAILPAGVLIFCLVSSETSALQSEPGRFRSGGNGSGRSIREDCYVRTEQWHANRGSSRCSPQ